VKKLANVAKGKKSYTGLAAILTGLALAKLKLDPAVTAVLTPQATDLIAELLVGAGAALNAFGIWAAHQVTAPIDQQDVVTPRPN